MAKKTYIGIADKAEKVKKIYIGVDGVARKVKAAYIGVNGVAKKIFASGVAEMAITYTGKHTDKIVTMGDGLQYRLLTLTSSGTLTLEEACNVDIWLCGGGKKGKVSAAKYSGGDGGDGGKFYYKYGLSVLSAAVTVAARGGVSKFGDYTSSVIAGAKGGDGGSMSGYTYGGEAPKESTQPFKDSYFKRYPCAGGGGGGFAYSGSNPDPSCTGSDGGSSTGAGKNGEAEVRGSNKGGTGGLTGGGNGQSGGLATDMTNASYYGSGGGGAGTIYNQILNKSTYGTPSYGYQGVVLVRIPLNQ